MQTSKISQKSELFGALSAVAGLHSKISDPPPGGPIFFQFHAVLGKIWQNRILAPSPGRLAPLREPLGCLPWGNPGSATVQCVAAGGQSPSHYYRPQQYLWKGIVFTGMCHSVDKGSHPWQGGHA